MRKNFNVRIAVVIEYTVSVAAKSQEEAEEFATSFSYADLVNGTDTQSADKPFVLDSHEQTEEATFSI